MWSVASPYPGMATKYSCVSEVSMGSLQRRSLSNISHPLSSPSSIQFNLSRNMFNKIQQSTFRYIFNILLNILPITCKAQFFCIMFIYLLIMIKHDQLCPLNCFNPPFELWVEKIPFGGMVEKKNFNPVFGDSTLTKLSDAFSDENAKEVRPWTS